MNRANFAVSKRSDLRSY